jgi:hypothetical protein
MIAEEEIKIIKIKFSGLIIRLIGAIFCQVKRIIKGSQFKVLEIWGTQKCRGAAPNLNIIDNRINLFISLIKPKEFWL